eukprot:3568647-Rhodomonas_salina.1
MPIILRTCDALSSTDTAFACPTRRGPLWYALLYWPARAVHGPEPYRPKPNTSHHLVPEKRYHGTKVWVHYYQESILFVDSEERLEEAARRVRALVEEGRTKGDRRWDPREEGGGGAGGGGGGGDEGRGGGGGEGGRGGGGGGEGGGEGGGPVCVGLDVEWKPSMLKGEGQRPASILQVHPPPSSSPSSSLPTQPPPPPPPSPSSSSTTTTPLPPSSSSSSSSSSLPTQPPPSSP